MKFTNLLSVKDISDLVNAKKVTGNINLEISGINEIHRVEEGDICFVDHPKYFQKVIHSKASLILINAETDCPAGKTLLLVEDPLKAYLCIVEKYAAFVPAKNSISESALIGEGSIVQPGVFIGNNVVIGKNCIIHSNVSIYDNSIIGNNVIIHSSSVIGADAFYFQKRQDTFVKFNSCGRVILKDHVEIGACCTIDKGVSSDTIIGEYTKFDNHCQVGHDTIIGNRCLIGAFCAIAGVTTIEDDVILWARVAINKDVVIGKGAILLATSATDKSLEGGKTYFGAPAEEARKKWKELAMIKRLPELFNK